jgi:hypothetical protein
MSTIVTRAGKGSALTHNEVDANFTNLNTDKVEKTGTDPVVISVNSSSDALRITQTGAGNALVVEDSTNPDSTPFVIDTSGNVITGSTLYATDFVNYVGTSVLPKVELLGSGISTASIAQAVYVAASAAPTIVHAKSRNATIGSHTIVNSGDVVGSWVAQGSDGTAFLNLGSIKFEVDGTPSTGDMPGRLVFSTTADGASTPTESMRIDKSGGVIIGSGEASATPVGNTLRAPDATGTNIAGGNLNISPGASTGNATGGYVSFSSGITPGASGSTANSLLERMRLYSTGTAADSPTGFHISTSGVYPSAVPLTNNGDRIASLMIHGLSESTASIGITNWGSSTSDEPNLNFLSLNGGTIGTFGTTPVSGSNLGNITFEGYSGVGSNMLLGAAIFAEASGTWTSTNAPTAIRLQTAAATGAVATRILIDEDAVSIENNTGFSISETTATTAALANAYIGNVSSGTYTPTLANTTNIAASTPAVCQYMRVGNVVTVSGTVTIDPTATGRIVMGMTLPIASAFATSTPNQCGGTFASSGTTTINAGSVAADGTNDRATFDGVVNDAASRVYGFSFTYQVL